MISMQSIVEHIQGIKPFSKIAQKIIQLLNNEEVSLKEVSDLIKYEPALTIQILKVVNSASFAHSQPIRDLFTAINYLGRGRIKQIVLIASSQFYFNEILEGYEFQEGEIWEQALSTAVIASHICDKWNNIDKDILFTAALLHDIGKIILSQFVYAEYTKIGENTKEGLDFLEAEKKVLGFNHCDIGASLLKSWGFSNETLLTAKYHHTPLEVDNKIVHIVAIAEYVAMIMGRVSQLDGLTYSGYSELLEKYDIQTNELETIICDSAEEIDKVLLYIKG